MAISGHNTRSVFDRYNIVSEKDLHEAARKLDRYLKAQDYGADGDTMATVKLKGIIPGNAERPTEPRLLRLTSSRIPLGTRASSPATPQKT